MNAATGFVPASDGDPVAQSAVSSRPWWPAFRRLLPLAGLYAVASGAKDLPIVASQTPAAWHVFMMTFGGESLGGLLLFALVALVDICPLHGPARVAAYVAAGIAGTFASLMVIIPLYFALGVWDGQMTFGVLVWGNMQSAMGRLFAIVLYRLWHRARQRAAVLRAIRLERAQALRRVAASRLQEMQARIDPAFLQDTMSAVERLHVEDPAAGERLLDDLIAYLRAALPEIGRTTSTLGKECDLARAYLDIVLIRDRLDLELRVEDPGGLQDAPFPPMMVLPLVNAALAAARAVPGATRLRMSAHRAASRVALTLALEPGRDLDRRVLERVRGTLRELHGDAASVETTSSPGGPTRIVIEVPHVEATGADR